MKRLLSDPRAYVAWLAVVVAALVAAYDTDPYLFGFAVYGFGAATGGVCLAGGFFVFMNPATSLSSKVAVLASLLLAVVAVLSALAILGTFNWA